MHLMSYDLSQEKLKTFARGTTQYDRVKLVIRVAGGGQVERAAKNVALLEQKRIDVPTRLESSKGLVNGITITSDKMGYRKLY
jgi:hypothetical protein